MHCPYQPVSALPGHECILKVVIALPLVSFLRGPSTKGQPLITILKRSYRGSAVDAPLLGTGLRACIGILCVLSVKNLKLRGRPAIVIGICWILIAIGWIGWMMRDILIK